MINTFMIKRSACYFEPPGEFVSVFIVIRAISLGLCHLKIGDLDEAIKSCEYLASRNSSRSEKAEKNSH